MTESASYSPSFLETLLPAPIADTRVSASTAPPDYASTEKNAYASNTSVTLSRRVGRRTNLSVVGDYQVGGYPDANGDLQRLSVYGLRAEFSQPMARNTTFRAAYDYRTGEYGFEGLGTTAEQGLVAGVDYTRRLSATRRIVFGFDAGSSTIGIPDTASTVGATVDRRYLANGETRLTYQFGRTWSVRAAYTRGLQYVGQLSEPVLADGANLGFGGLLTRHTDVQMSAAYSDGDSAIAVGTTRFRASTSDVRLRYALTRSVAAFVEGYLYIYSFQGGTPVLGLPPQFHGDGVRAGVTVWAPVIRR